MKIWSINFTGIWPVGSAAIVVTTDRMTEVETVDMFREQWSDQHPGSDPEPVTATLLDGSPGCVHILATGDY